MLLVEGNLRISAVIKYVTQSTWSHSCLYIGDSLSRGGTEPKCELIEADLVEGVVAVPLSKYTSFNTRICRPIGLTKEDTGRLIEYVVSRLGHRYDLKNFIDLGRYLLPIPMVPPRYRRRLAPFGSGDPTRAICATLLAQAFQSIHYPILPQREIKSAYRPNPFSEEVILRPRHYSHFAPRDFDLSPYFQIIKPPVATAVDYRKLSWLRDQWVFIAEEQGCKPRAGEESGKDCGRKAN